MSTITITYGESVENHVGNQQIGMKAVSGISTAQLDIIRQKMEKEGHTCIVHNLIDLLSDEDKIGATPATVLVVKNFVGKHFKDDTESAKMLTELKNLNWDSKALMRGRVVNKHARHNLCFADFNQEPDYDNGKGRVYDFKGLTKLASIRKYLAGLLGVNLNAEGNYYYDTKKCYIGMHGDQERRVVIGVRFGETFPLHYQWYHKSTAIGKPYEIKLDGGDLYIMSDKATGNDWKCRSIKTLRHAAGDPKNFV